MDSISIDEIRETVEKLCSIEYKIAGTNAEKKAAEYLKQRLLDYGLEDIEEELFDVHLWNPISCKLKVTKPIQKEIIAAVFPYSISNKVRGPLVRFHANTPDVHKKNSGMIGITSWGESLYLGPMKAYFQGLDQAAQAVIISSPDAGDLNKIVIISSGKLLDIPVINITKEEGEFLFNLLESGPVDVEIDLDVEYSDRASSMNLATLIKGSSNSKEEIVVGAHYDSWFKGAADNSAPVAIVIELARLLHKHIIDGGELKRNVRFLLFGAEESGSKDFYYWVNGSKAFVNSNKEIIENLIGMLNMDSIGYPPPCPNYIGTTSDLVEFVRSINPGSSSTKVEYYDPPGYGSDHWFFELAGVPSIFCVSHPSHLYHTQKDDTHHLDYSVVQHYAEFMREALLSFANSEVIPLDIFRAIGIFQGILSKYSRWRDSPFDLSRLLSKINRILNRRRQFERELKRVKEKGSKEEKERVNRFLLSTTRMMNRTIGWIWRVAPPDDIRYLARLEMIEDYIDLNASIRALRNMPVSNVGPHSATKLSKQKENPYNWIDVHGPLTMLEEERSKIFKEIEKEISNVKRILDSISKGISSIIGEK